MPPNPRDFLPPPPWKGLPIPKVFQTRSEEEDFREAEKTRITWGGDTALGGLSWVIEEMNEAHRIVLKSIPLRSAASSSIAEVRAAEEELLKKSEMLHQATPFNIESISRELSAYLLVKHTKLRQILTYFPSISYFIQPSIDAILLTWRLVRGMQIIQAQKYITLYRAKLELENLEIISMAKRAQITEEVADKIRRQKMSFLIQMQEKEKAGRLQEAERVLREGEYGSLTEAMGEGRLIKKEKTLEEKAEERALKAREPAISHAEKKRLEYEASQASMREALKQSRESEKEISEVARMSKADREAYFAKRQAVQDVIHSAKKLKLEAMRRAMKDLPDLPGRRKSSGFEKIKKETYEDEG